MDQALKDHLQRDFEVNLLDNFTNYISIEDHTVLKCDIEKIVLRTLGTVSLPVFPKFRIHELCVNLQQMKSEWSLTLGKGIDVEIVYIVLENRGNNVETICEGRILLCHLDVEGNGTVMFTLFDGKLVPDYVDIRFLYKTVKVELNGDISCEVSHFQLEKLTKFYWSCADETLRRLFYVYLKRVMNTYIVDQIFPEFKENILQIYKNRMKCYFLKLKDKIATALLKLFRQKMKCIKAPAFSIHTLLSTEEVTVTTTTGNIQDSISIQTNPKLFSLDDGEKHILFGTIDFVGMEVRYEECKILTCEEVICNLKIVADTSFNIRAELIERQWSLDVETRNYWEIEIEPSIGENQDVLLVELRDKMTEVMNPIVKNAFKEGLMKILGC